VRWEWVCRSRHKASRRSRCSQWEAKISKPDPPTPPNPYQTAAAQTGTNVSTGVANSFLNNVNQITPEGSLNYDVTGNYSWTDPSTGHAYNIPRFTSTQSLSPQGQALKAQNDATKMNLATMGNAQSAKVSGLLSTPFTPGSGAPTAGSAGGIMGVGQASTSFDPGWDITKSYGPEDNFGADRQRVEDAMMGRINPQLAKERTNVEQRLADQGIRYGSQAYTSAMDDYNRQSNDARFAAIGQAGDEQARLNQMAAAQAGFQNQAQAQGYQQNQGLASFRNAGLMQQLAQQQSGFNAQNAARNQYMQEQYQQRNQPLNEISALMSGSQVQQPNWLNSPTSQIATTDIGGLINQNFAQQSQNFQAANQNWQSTMGGLLGLGGKLGAAAIMSDRRAKQNIEKIGSVFSSNEDGDRKRLPVYEWEYKHDPGTRRVGPMAQDVEKIDPGAVGEIGGVKHIDANRVMGGILRAA